MENNGDIGSKGSHFEKLIFGDETMVSDDTLDAKFSKITLAVAKDSGWFEVDMGLGENYFWGKNEGCDIFNNTCDHTTVSEFCKDSKRNQCSDNHMYTTKCQENYFAGSCPINLNLINCTVPSKSPKDVWTHGKESICLNTLDGSNHSSGCYKIKCAQDNNSYQVFTHVGVDEKEFTCTKKGDTIQHHDQDFETICEDPSEICKTYTECPYDCNLRGRCLDNKTCDCGPFYSGAACQTFKGCSEEVSATFCQEILTANNVDQTNLNNEEDGGNNNDNNDDNNDNNDDNNDNNDDNNDNDDDNNDNDDDQMSDEKFTSCMNECESTSCNFRRRRRRRMFNYCIKKCYLECLPFKPLDELPANAPPSEENYKLCQKNCNITDKCVYMRRRQKKMCQQECNIGCLDYKPMPVMPENAQPSKDNYNLCQKICHRTDGCVYILNNYSQKRECMKSCETSCTQWKPVLALPPDAKPSYANYRLCNKICRKDNCASSFRRSARRTCYSSCYSSCSYLKPGYSRIKSQMIASDDTQLDQNYFSGVRTLVFKLSVLFFIKLAV